MSLCMPRVFNRFVLTAYIISFSLLMAALPAPVSAAAAVGSVPALVAQDIDGKVVDLRDLRGKVVLVEFWATWCPSCRAEMPLLDAYYRSQRAKGLEIVAVSIDKPEKREKVRQVIQSVSYHTLMLDGIKANNLAVPGVIPTIYVLDKNGVLRYIDVPDGNPETPVTLAGVEAAVKPLLKN